MKPTAPRVWRASWSTRGGRGDGGWEVGGGGWIGSGAAARAVELEGERRIRVVGGERLERRMVGQVDRCDVPSLLALWENQASRPTAGVKGREEKVVVEAEEKLWLIERGG